MYKHNLDINQTICAEVFNTTLARYLIKQKITLLCNQMAWEVFLNGVWSSASPHAF